MTLRQHKNHASISRALDYSLKCWTTLSRHLDDEAVSIDNN
ncbi:IS66 family transposase [Pseudomonas donghuensis]